MADESKSDYDFSKLIGDLKEKGFSKKPWV